MESKLQSFNLKNTLITAIKFILRLKKLNINYNINMKKSIKNEST